MALNSNARQNIPALFIEIMNVHEQLGAILAQPVIPFGSWRLVRRNQDLKRAAEKSLHWNVDKGNTA